MGQPSPAVTGATFLNAPIATATDLRAGDIGVIGVGHELTKLSRPGAAFGPQAIRQATYMIDWMGEQYAAPDLGNGLVNFVEKRAYRYQRDGIYDLGDVKLGPDLSLNRDRIRAGVGAIAKSGALPVVLGGDHYLSYPSTLGVCDGNPGKLALLSLDMHLDLANFVPEFGTHNGASWLRRLIAENAIDPARVVIFGTEPETFREEYEFVITHGIQVISSSEVARRGVEATLGPALERALDGADGLYATLDIDAGARSLVPGTGNQTGVVGVSPGEMLEVASHLADLPLKGVDISELAPALDPSGLTAGLCAAMLVRVLAPRLYAEVAYPTVDGPGSAA